MNAAIKKSCFRRYGQTAFGMACVAMFAVVFAVAIEVRAQDPARKEILAPPPKSNLGPVHLPDVTILEAAVREQIMMSQNALAAAVKDPSAPIATLSEAYGAMGELYHAYSLLSPARECYLNAGKLTRKDFRWVYLLGQLDQQDGRSDEAISRYLVARALRPDYVAVPVNLGKIYLELNRLADAESSFREALALDKSSPAAYYGLGQIALAKRNYAEAVNHFEKALAEVPEANRIHYSLAMAYRGLGDAEKVRTQLAQQGPVGVRVADPLLDELQELIQGERVHLIRGKLAVGVQRYIEAAEEFRKAVAAKPDSTSARLNLGTTLMELKDFQGATAQYEEVLRIDPRNTVAHFNLAVNFANENQHERAVAHLQSVLAVAPDDLGSRLFLAQELKKSQRFDEALVEFSRVVQSDPGNEAALLEQVKLLLQRKRYKQALESLENSHAQYPQRGLTAAALVYLLAASPQYDLRDGARAVQLAQAIYQASGSLEHGALIALALAELGRCSEAAAWQRQLIAAAEQERKTDLATKLSADLKVYEQAQPCRPAGDAAGQTKPN